MDISTAFQELGVSAILGTQLLDTFGLTTDDLIFPQRFSKLQSVISYLKQFPEDTQRFLINKATRGKQVDKLDHFFDYTKILKQKESYEKDLENIEREFSVVQFSDDVQLIGEIKAREKDVREKIHRLTEEKYLYE